MDAIKYLAYLEDDSGFRPEGWDGNEPISLRMLFEIKDDTKRIVETCQTLGLIAKTMECICGGSMKLHKHENFIDKYMWVCSVCFRQKFLKDGSWFEEVRNMDLIGSLLMLYCYAHGYTKEDCKREFSQFYQPLFIPIIFRKCSKLSNSFFKHKIAKIGSAESPIILHRLQKKGDYSILAGIDSHRLDFSFIVLLPYRFNKWDICRAIIQNVSEGSVAYCKNRKIHKLLQTDGKQYLKTNHNIKLLNTKKDLSYPLGCLQSIINRTVLHNIEYSQDFVEDYLLKRRLATCEDPFLCLIKIITIIHPLPIEMR